MDNDRRHQPGRTDWANPLPQDGFSGHLGRAGFNRQRFLIPTVIGLIHGTEAVLRDLPKPSLVHLKLPLSIPFYAYGAVLLEVMLRLFAVTFLTWLIANVILRGRAKSFAFWVAAVAACYEPWPFIREELATSAHCCPKYLRQMGDGAPS